MGSTDNLATLARPLLEAAGLDLWDVETGPRLVRILVDRDGGVDLDAVAAANAAIAPLLEEHDELLPAGPFDLEVSSPGIERTLRTTDHFQRSVGETVSVRTRTAIDGARRFQGRLEGIADAAIEVAVDGQDPVRIPLGDIDRARIVFEWGSPAKKSGTTKGPGGGKQAKHAGQPAAKAAKQRDVEDDDTDDRQDRGS